MFLTLRVVTEQPYNLHDLHRSVCNVRNINALQLSDSIIQYLYVTNYRSMQLAVLPGAVYCHISSQDTLWWEYRYGRTTTFRSTSDRIYDGGPIRLYYIIYYIII